MKFIYDIYFTHMPFFIYIYFEESKFICENQSDRLSCSNNDVITIRSINFGRTNPSVCGMDPNTYCYSSGKVTANIARTCNSQNSCQLTASAASLGEDPCSGTSKYLDVQYDCNPPPTTTTTTTTTTTPPSTQPQSSSAQSGSIASPNAGLIHYIPFI